MVLHRKKEGIEDALDAAGVRENPVRVLNDVLLPAMKDVGDKFGAGELILPFVLQSAEVMKRAVKHLEQFLEKAGGLYKGQGRAGYRVRRRARHRQVARQHDPQQQRLHRVRPRQAGAGEHDHREGARSRRGRDRSLGAAREHEQADAALRAGAGQARHPDPGADRRRGDQPSLRASRAVRRARARVRVRRVLLQGRVRGAGDDGRAAGRRRASRGGDRASCSTRRATTRSCTATSARTSRRASRAASAATSRTITRSPRAPFLGTRVLEDIPLDEVFELLDLDELYRLQWGGRGSGPEYDRMVREEFEPALARLKARGGRATAGCSRRRCTATSRRRASATISWSTSRSRTRATARSSRRRDSTSRGRKGASGCASRTTSARRRAATSTSWRSRSSRSATKRRAGSSGSRRRASTARRSTQHGLAVESAEAVAEWMHRRIRRELGIPGGRGKRYSWGYGACPGSRGSRAALQAAAGRRGARHGADVRVPAHSRAEHGGGDRAPSAGEVLRRAHGGEGGAGGAAAA